VSTLISRIRGWVHWSLALVIPFQNDTITARIIAYASSHLTTPFLLAIEVIENYEQPLVAPQPRHFKQVPFLTSLNSLQLWQASPSYPCIRAILTASAV
jgi:hypothetical protein